jgi:hypothetical protein
MDEQIVDLLTKGHDAKKAPHKKAIGCLSADDAKAVATSVKSVKESSAQRFDRLTDGVTFAPREASWFGSLVLGLTAEV